jgi:hypothetical protein
MTDATKDSGGRRRWLVAAGVGALVAAGQTMTWPSPDVAWNLYAGREVLHGARVGVDILENSPPMIFWLEWPALMLSAATGLSPWRAWVLWLTACSVLAAAMAGPLLPAAISSRVRQLAGPVLLVLLLLVPGGDFGQREHLTMVLVFPAVLLAARRITGDPVAWSISVAAGILAGFSISIKPHFILVWSGMVGLASWRRGLRGLWLPEHVAVVAVGVCYLTAMVVYAPGYFEYVATYGPLYQRFLPVRPWELFVIGEGAFPGVVAVGLWMPSRRNHDASERALGDALATACVCFYVVAVLQAKGWRYQFLPSILTAAALLVMVSLTPSAPRGWLRRGYRLAGVLTLVLLVSAGGEDTFRRLRRDPALAGDPNMAVLLPVLSSVGPGEAVAVLSSNIFSSFPLVLESGRRWSFRFPSLWPLVALYDEQIQRGGLVRFRSVEERPPLERAFVAAIVDDLLRMRPAVILAPRPDPELWGWGGARRFDYLALLRGEPRLGDAWLAGYRRGPDAGDYVVLRRADLQ